MRWLKKRPPVVTAALRERRAAPVPSRHPDPVRAARRLCARARGPVAALPALPQPQSGMRRAGSSANGVRRPAEGLARTRSPGHRRCHCGGRGHAEQVQRHSCRTESGRAPPCMRWRGPARPRRTGWPVAWPCRRRAPPAGARYPCEGPVSRLLPRSRGRPRAVPVSSGGIFLLHPRAPRKGLQGTISGVSAIHIRFHRKLGVIRISPRLSTGLFTVYPQPGDMSRRTPGLLIPDVIG